MKKDYNETLPFKPKNKESELITAKKFQNRLFPSRLIYYFIPIIVLYLLLNKIYKFNIQLDDTHLMWMIGIFWIVVLYSLISTLILGVCPHCHRFQKLNGKAIGMDSNSISYTKGISPFIKYCSRCGAPLSEKAVKEVYEKLEKEKP
ncbi:hypothetical protein PL75_07800 [Neisseria arctica]|uniref:Uncharacterized protein n=1 Tax=Neisseria arctica TaxID=1470200 RepID=A0A0J0YR19_9NEIS|nr:hypothetical protein [Neisseria arctica]KLT72596.1 hypothetical protein PL75_07800 [Neisseria arctica]UOO87653.1 hypothetical protein LVJ86_05250 [Neisseria arctica]